MRPAIDAHGAWCLALLREHTGRSRREILVTALAVGSTLPPRVPEGPCEPLPVGGRPSHSWDEGQAHAGLDALASDLLERLEALDALDAHDSCAASPSTPRDDGAGGCASWCSDEDDPDDSDSDEDDSDCPVCGGSGGGPDRALRCGYCRGLGENPFPKSRD